VNKFDCFESERLLYRGISEQDADSLVKWRSEGDLIRYFKNPEPLTLKGHMEWFNNFYLYDDSRFDFVIMEKASHSGTSEHARKGIRLRKSVDSKIGTVGVNVLDYHKKSCEISYMIAEIGARRKGYGSEAVLALICRLKQEGICHFYTEIHGDNLASIRTSEKLGFLQYSQQGDFLLFGKDET